MGTASARTTANGDETTVDRIRDLEAERDELAARLAAAERDLAEANRSRDAFLATASHEIRNAVATLVLSLGGMDRSLAGEVDPPRLKRSLATAHRSLALLRGLLDDMQDGVRFRTGPVDLAPDVADLAEVADSVARAVAAKAQRAGSSVEVVARPAPGVWDRARLERATFHLVQNALRFAKGTPVRLEVGSGAGVATLVVADGGPGIDPADHGRIFEPFVRAGSSEAGGLGLGLFIARRIVEAHGGTLAVESGRGQGARFIVSLPTAPPPGP